MRNMCQSQAQKFFGETATLTVLREGTGAFLKPVELLASALQQNS